MKNLFLKAVSLSACLTATVMADAKIQLPDIISDNMVLQQNARVRLWGKADINKEVTVTASWDQTTYSTHSDANGSWLLEIPTPEADYTPRQITFSDGEPLVVKNILIGEVWFCSGQSNMEMPLRGFWNCPVQGANEAILHAGEHKGIRFATIEHVAALTPQREVPGKWAVSNPENAVAFSATAYFFAVSVNRVLNVPVGIINCSWGGSKVEGWLPESIVKEYTDINLKDAGSKDCVEYLQPIIMYNGMLKPLQNYTINGFLWYQGESNVGHHDTYADRMKVMVDLWRKEWGLGELPFYFVELAPYDSGPGNGFALLREAQYKAQALIPNSGMISTNDLVEPYEAWNIHPKNKEMVGKRLSYMVLKNVYGVKGIYDRGPEYKSMEVKDGKVLLSFENADDGFNRRDGIVGFEIAGEDKVFHPAVAKVVQNMKIEVSSEQVFNPVAVRYCFQNFQPGNVANLRELPLVPFRTDNW